MNSWNFTGNLGRDSESRALPNGDPVVSFSVGVKSGYGKNESTTWANCSMFGKRAESVAPYLLKGQLVGIVGEVSLREWTDKDGNKRQNLDVRVNDLTLLGKSEAKEVPRKSNVKTPPASSTDDDDRIPF
jgi:single-strand DNA-binding protein